MKSKIQNISAQLPRNLIEEATEITHQGITETIRLALENLIRFNAYQNIRKLKGQVKFSINLEELRKDK